MFQWRNELDKLDDDLADMTIDYIENKIEKFSLNDSGTNKITGLTKKFGLADILEAIDISAGKYLRYDSDGCLTQQSAEDFINKIGGILVNKNRPPVDQKLSYIKGICRNRFNYWDVTKGSIILNNYIKVLRDYGWDEERILADLENELIPKTKETKNWSEWRGLLEKWTEDVRSWQNSKQTEEAPERSVSELDEKDEQIEKVHITRVTEVSLSESSLDIICEIEGYRLSDGVEFESGLDPADCPTLLSELFELEEPKLTWNEENGEQNRKIIADFNAELKNRFDNFEWDGVLSVFAETPFYEDEETYGESISSIQNIRVYRKDGIRRKVHITKVYDVSFSDDFANVICTIDGYQLSDGLEFTERLDVCESPYFLSKMLGIEQPKAIRGTENWEENLNKDIEFNKILKEKFENFDWNDIFSIMAECENENHVGERRVPDRINVYRKK